MDAPTSNPPHSQPQTHVSSGSGRSQIRSRVTVVCAECKRLKLKCDRRTPCSSCIKRDTVPRCTYSAAAVEKIDVQSLHNRVLALESQLSQIASGKPVKVPSNDLDNAMLALGASGSSVLVPLDSIAGVWLDHFDLGPDSGVDLHPVFAGASPECASALPHSDESSSKSPTFPEYSFIYDSSPSSVTPALLRLLPSTPQRNTLLDTLSHVLRMHPCLNYPYFRARITAMFAASGFSDDPGVGSSRVHVEKPTLSFFAAAAAGFALAIQYSSNTLPLTSASSPRISTPSRTSTSSISPAPSSVLPSVSSLLAISSHILNLVEATMAYDLDFLHALVLRCLCMLHDGQPRINQAVFSTVGQMVNVARLMGLAHDPDEFTSGAAGKYSLWEAEMRRRMWWEVFYYDLFISDSMGFAPLISDDQHTCRLPADVDEDMFVPRSVALPQPSENPGARNFAYFVQKCKLAQLVKNMKKRIGVGHDPPVPDSESNISSSAPKGPSIEVVSQAEVEIQQYLLELPQAFKLDVDTDPRELSYSSSSSALSAPPASDIPSSHLMIQRCELLAIAHQLILKLFHPFLRRPGLRPSDSAMIASVNASHAIIHASRVARGVWQRQEASELAGKGAGSGSSTMLSSHGVFYPFARQLFDAAVIAAHIVIQAPQSVVAKVALDDVRVALDVLRDPSISTGRGRAVSRGGVEGAPSEAVTIVEMMLRKAEMAKRNYVPVAAGTKRKHEEIDPSLSKGFWLPYVGTGVATERDTTTYSASKHSDKTPNSEPAPYRQSISTSQPRPAAERDHKYSASSVRSRVSTGSLSDMKTSGGVLQLRDSSMPDTHPVSSRSAAQEDTEMFTHPDASSSTNPDIHTDVADCRGDFSLSNPFGHEGGHLPASVFPQASPPPLPPPHTYSTHPFRPPSVPMTHQSMYGSNSFVSDSPARPTPPPSFFASYPPTFPSVTSQIDMMTNGHTATKEKQSGEPQVNARPPPFAPEGWTDNGLPRFDPPWDGFTY